MAPRVIKEPPAKLICYRCAGACRLSLKIPPKLISSASGTDVVNPAFSALVITPVSANRCNSVAGIDIAHNPCLLIFDLRRDFRMRLRYLHYSHALPSPFRQRIISDSLFRQFIIFSRATLHRLARIFFAPFLHHDYKLGARGARFLRFEFFLFFFHDYFIF